MRVMDDALIQNLPAPTQPSDLDGWTADDMTGWLATSIRTTVAAEERTEEMRVACGLVLYRLRVELGDGDYGAALDEVAREAGVTARTLTTWRTKAEARFQLAPPSERTVARRARVDSGSLPKFAAPPTKRQPKALTVPPTGTDNGSGPSSEVAKPIPPLPQPATKQDYRRLVSLLVTAGAATLATSVGHDELAKAHRVLGQAVAASAGTPAAPRPVGGGRCSCRPPKPKTRSGTAGLLLCEGCGKAR